MKKEIKIVNRQYFCKDCGKKIHWSSGYYGGGRCRECVFKKPLKNRGHKSTCSCCCCKAKRGYYTSSRSLSWKGGISKQKYYCKRCHKRICWQTAVHGKGFCMSCGHKLSWEDSIYKDRTLRKMLEGRKQKPNYPEDTLYKLLNSLYPGQYKYVGNGEVILEGFSPDFIHTQGKKKIIEVFGEYWHADPDKYKPNHLFRNCIKAKEIWEKDSHKLKTFSKLGYKTLVIWEKDLKDNQKLANKLIEFNNLNEEGVH